MLLLLEDRPCPQPLGLWLPAELVHLRDLPKDILVILQIKGQRLPGIFRVLTSLRSLQLLLKLGLLCLQALDVLFQFPNLSRMLPVSFIKLVPHIESLVKALGNFGILLNQGVLVVYGLIQSMRLQERLVSNVL